MFAEVSQKVAPFFLSALGMSRIRLHVIWK
jgi:hypothetical protein